MSDSASDKENFLQSLTFSPGDTILRQGAEGTYALYIESGRVEVSVINNNGIKTVLSEMGAGHVIGEMALISKSPRNATVTALEVTKARKISAEDFRTQLAASSKIFRAILEILVDRLSKSNTLLVEKSMAKNAAEEDLKALIAAISQRLPEKDRLKFESESARPVRELVGILNKFQRLS